MWRSDVGVLRPGVQQFVGCFDPRTHIHTLAPAGRLGAIERDMVEIKLHEPQVSKRTMKE